MTSNEGNTNQQRIIILDIVEKATGYTDQAISKHRYNPITSYLITLSMIKNKQTVLVKMIFRTFVPSSNKLS